MATEAKKAPEIRHFDLRLPKSLYEAVSAESDSEGTSMNNIILLHLGNSMGKKVQLFKRGRKSK